MVRQSDCRNRLLAVMSGQDFAILAPHLAPTDLPLGMIVAEANRPIETIFFPETGVASMIATTPSGIQVEAGLIGREGFSVPALVLNTLQLPYGSLIQVPGHGHSIGRDVFLRAIDDNPSLLRLMLRFAQCLIIQTSYTALSNGAHELDVRLARWLLMIHDRSPSDDLPVTHEFLSIMLAVRRPSVTNALHVLEGHGLIRAERGCILIRNRADLEVFAGDAYGIPEDEYRRLIGPLD